MKRLGARGMYSRFEANIIRPRWLFLTASINEEKRIASIENLSNCTTADRLLEVLCTVCRIKSGADLEKIQLSVANYVKLLPGPVTPQKYSGLDFDVKINIELYRRILEEIIEKFDRNWPLNKDDLDPLIEKLMIVDGATVSMLSESLRTLISALSETNDEKKIRTIATILENTLKSDAIFSATIDACRNEKTLSYMQEEEIDQAWQSVTQILVSLPNRVANKMRFKTLELYTPEIYVKILHYHISRVISFINDGLCECGIEPKTTPLSSFINKIVITFKPIANLTCLVAIFEDWCFENRKNERRLVERILGELDSTAVEHVAALFLKRCDPKFGVRAIFGDLLLTTPRWNYVLTVKIPLMRYYEDERLIINLISYLLSFSNKNANLSELLIKLLEVWCDGSILNHTAVEQHEYITRLIILSVKVCKNHLEQSKKIHCQRLLLSGVSAHLECTDIYLRAMGMMTAEICVNSLFDTDNAPKLTFEYDDMPTRVLKLLDSLKRLSAFAPSEVESRYEPSSDLTVGNVTFDSSASKKMYELGVECDILPNFEHMSSEKMEDTSPKGKDLVGGEVATKRTQQPKKNSHRTDHSDLDSDDDLIPYDMDDDKDKAFDKVRPLYLRDLRDNLTDERASSNPDVFSESLLTCEELVLAQLPGDDVSFAIELLQLLATLGQHSYVENFELVVFRCCVAIVTVYPKECAEFLCKQLYADAGTYSLSQRLLFLDILAESAKRLSKINTDNTDISLDIKMKKTPVPNRVSLFLDKEKYKTREVYYHDGIDLETSEDRPTNWQEIIDKRIASHTRRFAHETKSAATYSNYFSNVVSSFFYPLLHGFGYRGKVYKLKDLKGEQNFYIYKDQENILLLRFLKTLSTIMLAAQNCPSSPKMGKEILELTWTLRGHDEAAVRLAVTENVGSVLVAVPKDAIIDELSGPLMEIREWLLLSLNVIYGEHDTNCRALNTKILYFINSIIGSMFS